MNNLKDNIVEYKIYSNANTFNDLISKEVKSNLFNKKYNLTGEYSSEGGINLYNKISYITFKPNFGPLVKINIKSIATNNNESKIIIKKIDSITYKIHKWFAIIFMIISLSICIYQIASSSIKDKLEMFIMPLFGIVYFLIINLIKESSTENLIKRVLKLLKDKKIKYKNL